LALREAVAVEDGPTVLRFPKGSVGEAIQATGAHGDLDILRDSEDPDLLLISVGAMAGICTSVAEKLGAQGISTKVIDPRWVLPVSDDLLQLARTVPAVAVVEDNLVDNGIGAAVAARLRAAGEATPVWTYGIPKQFLDHGSRGQVLERIGLTPDTIA